MANLDTILAVIDGTASLVANAETLPRLFYRYDLAQYLSPACSGLEQEQIWQVELAEILSQEHA